MPDRQQVLDFITPELLRVSRMDFIADFTKSSHSSRIWSHPRRLGKDNINQYFQNRRSIRFLIRWKNRVFITPSFREMVLDSHGTHQSPNKRQLV